MTPAPYVTPADVREGYPSLADPATWSDALLASLIDEFEGIAERYRGIAYRERTAVEEFAVPWGCTTHLVALKWPHVSALTSLTLDGVDVLTTGYHLNGRLGLITDMAISGQTTGSVLATEYTHGLADPLAAVRRACIIYTRNTAKATTSGTSRDVLSQAVDGATTRYATPDWWAGRPTGYLEVDRLLNSVDDYRVPAIA